MTNIDKQRSVVRRTASTGVAATLAALTSMGLAVAPAARAADTAALDDIHAFRLPVDDPRTAVRLAGEDRAYVLGQMRLFVVTFQRMADALAKDEPALAAQAAALAGARRHVDDPRRPAGIVQRFPAAWNQYSSAVRRGFDAIAESAATAPPRETQRRVAELMSVCVACHQAYRRAEEAPAAPAPGR